MILSQFAYLYLLIDYIGNWEHNFLQAGLAKRRPLARSFRAWWRYVLDEARAPCGRMLCFQLPKVHFGGTNKQIETNFQKNLDCKPCLYLTVCSKS